MQHPESFDRPYVFCVTPEISKRVYVLSAATERDFKKFVSAFEELSGNIAMRSRKLTVQERAGGVSLTALVTQPFQRSSVVPGSDGAPRTRLSGRQSGRKSPGEYSFVSWHLPKQYVYKYPQTRKHALTG